MYDNPVEGKLAHDNVERMAQHNPIWASLWDVLQSEAMIDMVKQISSIPDLENDPFLHGAGLHYHPVGAHPLYLVRA